MARRRSDLPSPSEFPIDAGLWLEVAAALRLSPKQARVVQLAVQGRTRKEIAESMGSAECTIKSHLERVYRGLEVRDRHELIPYVFAVAIFLLQRRPPNGCRPNGRHPQ